ncbi:MAG: ankyrin repeat domain-containing protein [Oligoflexia bacterium]|nr:ankyrin repeat domain-containing protein [Oligoflexia bacterium]
MKIFKLLLGLLVLTSVFCTRQADAAAAKPASSAIGCFDRMLFNSAKYDQTLVTKALISIIGVRVDTFDDQQMTPLMYAAMNGNTSTSAVLIDYGADVNATDLQGRTPLFFAVMNDHENTARMLINKGADVNATDLQNRTPLFLATMNGFTDTARMLIGKRANVNATDLEGKTPLFYATENNHTYTVKLLKQRGAMINTARRREDTAPSMVPSNAVRAEVQIPIEISTAWPSLQEAAYEVLSKKILLVSDVHNHSKLLKSLALWTNNEIIHEVLTLLNSIVITTEEINSPYQETCYSNESTCLLADAINSKKFELAIWALDHHANPNMQIGKTKETPLHIIAKNQTWYTTSTPEQIISLIQKLKDSGADFNALDTRKISPIITAVKHGNFELAVFFITNADFLGIDKNSYKFVLHYLSQMKTSWLFPINDQIVGMTSLLQALHTKGIEINDRDDQGRTPLLIAIDNRKEDIFIDWLLINGANPTLADNENRNPISEARENGDNILVDKLENRGSDHQAALSFPQQQNGPDENTISETLNNHLVIIVNFDINVQANDIMARAFQAALFQGYAPIIVSQQLFVNIGIRGNLLSNWRVFSNTGSLNDSFFILIPELMLQNSDLATLTALTALGFNANLSAFEMPLPPAIVQAHNRNEIGDLKSLFSTDYQQNSKKFNIALIGHGSPPATTLDSSRTGFATDINSGDGRIAGLSGTQFKDFLLFLNSLPMNAFVYFSCFGGANLLGPYYDTQEQPLLLNFPIVEIATTSSRIYEQLDKRDQARYLNFRGFFKEADSYTDENTSEKLSAALRHVCPSKGPALATHTPLIRYPLSTKFVPFPLSSQGVKVIDNTSTQNNFDKLCDALLIYPSIINDPITIETRYGTKIVSMDPRPHALHIINKLEVRTSLLPGHTSEEIINNLFALDGFRGKKVYFIISKLVLDRAGSIEIYNNLIIDNGRVSSEISLENIRRVAESFIECAHQNQKFAASLPEQTPSATPETPENVVNKAYEALNISPP